MRTREEIEAALKRYAEGDYPKRCRETISQWDEYWQPIQLADDQELLANAYLADRQQRERDQQPPTREMCNAVREWGLDCVEWNEPTNTIRWYNDNWFIDITTIAKLRAACLLLGINTEGML